MIGEMEVMYPVQFVEGLNENEEPATGRFLTWEESGIALPYTPAMTYSLGRIEIYGAPRDLRVQTKHPVRLHTDHRDRPSRNSIADGKLIVPQGNSGQWLEVMMEQNIIVIAKRKYWVAFEEHPLSFSMGLAQEGEELGLRTGFAQSWSPSSLGKHKCMLRFYGRMMPATSLLVTREDPYSSKSLGRIERCLAEILKLMREQRELLVREDTDDVRENDRLQKHSQYKTRR